MKGEIRFIKGRLRFKGRNTKGELVNYPATFGSVIVIFKKQSNPSDKSQGFIQTYHSHPELKEVKEAGKLKWKYQ